MNNLVINIIIFAFTLHMWAEENELMKQLEKKKEELLIQLEEEKKTSSQLLGDLYELLVSCHNMDECQW